MIIITNVDNSSINHPLHYLTECGRVIGQFYNSRDKKYHLSEYIPYKELPDVYLCGGKGNFAGSRANYEDRNKCKQCFSQIVLPQRKTQQESGSK